MAGPNTNSIGKGKKTLTLSVTKEFHAQLTELAKKSGMSLATYCRVILVNAHKRKVRAGIEYVIDSGDDSSSSPPPTRNVLHAAQLGTKIGVALNPKAGKPSEGKVAPNQPSRIRKGS